MFKKKINFLEYSYKKNVSFMLFVYWAILVIWQNIGGADSRSSIDLIIKIGLLIYLVSYYLLNTRTVSKRIIWVLFFSILMLVTLSFEATITISILISYIFPIVFILMTYCFGCDFEVNQRQLIAFLNSIILVVLYSAIYAIIFCQNQFTSVFSISGAYGNELSSFFVSSHEYGMYLVYGITACIIIITLKKEERVLKKIPYIFVIIIFLINLILTFSRTSLLAAFLLLVIYILFYKSLKFRIVTIIIVIFAAILINYYPKLNEFVFQIILKENNMAGRDLLSNLSIQYYNNGTIIQKLFGHGITESRQFFANMTGHGSIHNAYLQVLIYYGVTTLISMVLFLLSQLYACIKLIKKDKFIGVLSLGILTSAVAMMFTNTAMIFNSPIDSYFLTMFALIIPKYMRNAVNKNRFYMK